MKTSTPHSWSSLNWRELALLVDSLRPEIEGAFIDRVIVPERPRFPAGYLKGEWVLRLTGRGSDRVLVFSVRPRHPYLAVSRGKGPKAAPEGTHSPFSLALSKQVRGARVTGIEVVKRERVVILWLSGEEKIGIVLFLIPATPEALLVRDEDGALKILARSSAKEAGTLEIPDGAKAPEDPPVREELVGDPSLAWKRIEAALDREAFELRAKGAEKIFRERVKTARDRVRQNETSANGAALEPNWLSYGVLLKNVLTEAPPIRDGKRHVMNFETGEYIDIPSDPKLSPQDQVEKFFSLERRKKRRGEEATTRLANFREVLAEGERMLARVPELLESGDWAELEKFERKAGIVIERAGPEKGSKGGVRAIGWTGRTCVSKDGIPILVGRSKDENLELTQKHARGNDMWFHVRGRPGAHVVVPVQGGKSVPLETMLDAAVLCLYFSNGEKWGKTEVDYTFKKYVKRIKNSSEVSYTNNKTLIVAPEPERLKRLLAKE